MKSNSGFTLAEIMIVVAIVGIVAALTLSSIVANFQNESLAIRLKRIIQNIESATENLMYDEGKNTFSATSAFSGDNGVREFLNNYFETTDRSCNDINCFGDRYISIQEVDYNVIRHTPTNQRGVVKQEADFNCENGVAAQLSDSSSVCIMDYNMNTGDKDDSGNDIFDNRPDSKIIQIDINGKAGPNRGGRDMFKFLINPRGEVEGYISYDRISTLDDNGVASNTRHVTSNSGLADLQQSCLLNALGESCSYILMSNNFNMNYDVNWDSTSDFCIEVSAANKDLGHGLKSNSAGKWCPRTHKDVFGKKYFMYIKEPHLGTDDCTEWTPAPADGIELPQMCPNE